MKKLLSLVGLLCLLVSARAQAAAGPGEGGDTVSYPSGDEQASGFLAKPQAGGRHPALIVIHEWWGLNDFARNKARTFASRGYVSLAVDLYRGKVATDPDTAHQLMRGMPEDRALRDLRAAFRYLAGRKDVDPARIGVVGWCMGGGLALSLAVAEPTLAAGVIYYGRLITDPAQIQKIKAPLLLNFGDLDKGIPADSVRAFAAAAEKAKVKVDAKVFAASGHAFASSSDPKVFRPAEAAEADGRTESFFSRLLRPGK